MVANLYPRYFKLEEPIPFTTDESEFCPMLKYNKSSDLMMGKFAACTGKALAICLSYPDHDPCRVFEEADAAEAPSVDKLINNDMAVKMQREKTIWELRYTYRSLYQQLDLTRASSNLFELLWFSTLPCSSIIEGRDYSMLKKCEWMGQEIPCSNIFTMSPTDRGMCCVFNMAAAEEMFRDSWYQNIITRLQEEDRDQEHHIPYNLPKFESAAGRNKGLSVVLDARSDTLSLASVDEDFQGFLATVDGRTAVPQTDVRGFHLRPGHDNLVALSATSVKAASRIKDVDPHTRNCYFKDEMSLDLFTVYSQASCLLECRIKYVLFEKNVSCIPW